MNKQTQQASNYFWWNLSGCFRFFASKFWEMAETYQWYLSSFEYRLSDEDTLSQPYQIHLNFLHPESMRVAIPINWFFNTYPTMFFPLPPCYLPVFFSSPHSTQYHSLQIHRTCNQFTCSATCYSQVFIIHTSTWAFFYSCWNFDKKSHGSGGESHVMGANTIGLMVR